jgi:hypothetical protein
MSSVWARGRFEGVDVDVDLDFGVVVGEARGRDGPACEPWMAMSSIMATSGSARGKEEERKETRGRRMKLSFSLSLLRQFASIY